MAEETIKCPFCGEVLVKTAPDCFEHRDGCGPCHEELERMEIQDAYTQFRRTIGWIPTKLVPKSKR